MRFDDRLTTASAMGRGDTASATMRWVQLIDVVAQAKGLDAPERKAALEEACRLSPSVDARRKRSVALAIAGRAHAPDLVAVFANEAPQIAAPVLLGAVLSGRDWQALIPRMPPASRALLRERRDLPPLATGSLAAFGRADFALPNRDQPQTEPGFADTPAGPSQTGVSQISDLVARIETFRSRRDAPEANGKTNVGRAPEGAAWFEFETDASGSVIWVEGGPLAAFIGIDLSMVADETCPGVDASTAEAFARRDAIESGRLTLPEGSRHSGVWQIDALPLFVGAPARFAGYAGIARQREAAETANGSQHELLRQIVHELRSPLNAIRGFAELVEHQVVGPVGQSYRTRASAIIDDSGLILTRIEQLDRAAKARAVERQSGSTADTFGDAAHALA